MEKLGITRRRFVADGAIAVSAMAVANHPFNLFGAGGKEDRPLRIGLIGAGNRGTGMAYLLKDIKEISLEACCDIQEDNLNKVMKMASRGARKYRNFEKLLGDKNVDAVIIASPLHLHYPMAVAAIDAGKHVYVEKTMTYDIPQAIDMVKRMKNSKLTFQVGHQYRYYALYRRVKEVLSEGWLGKVTHFECQYHRNSDWRSPVSDPKLERIINWRMYKEYSGGLMTELCGHPIDIVNWMLESHPLKVVGMGGIDYWKDGRETYDNVRTVFEYPNGVKSSVSSILSNAHKGYSIRILGDKGTLEIERDRAFLYAENTKKIRGTVDGVTGATITTDPGKGQLLDFSQLDILKKDPTTYALLDFADCIRSGRKPVSNVETGRDVAIASHLGNLAIATGLCQFWKPEYSV